MIGNFDAVRTESALEAVAWALGAPQIAGWTAEERARLGNSSATVDVDFLSAVREAIRRQEDPLGHRFASLRPAPERRSLGAVYTPGPIVEHMVSWASDNGDPVRIIDPGAGSGRYLLAAAARFPKAELVGIEIDPLAAMLCRANLAVAGLAERSTVILGDYRAFRPARVTGATLYIGNPPYVRHHQISPDWKRWLSAEATKGGYRHSQLAGLHAHFFLATAVQAQAGDYGTFITAAEWLDVNYGRLVRDLFLGRLGGLELLVVEPSAAPFPDTATTAAITRFRIAARPQSVLVSRASRVQELAAPETSRQVTRETLARAERWSPLSRSEQQVPSGFIELGELFRVHRGQVTGANRIWIADRMGIDLPTTVLFPAVTRARELLDAGLFLERPERLRQVIDLPVDLDSLQAEDRRRVERFLRLAKSAGADSGYVAQNRKAWWSVGLKEAAPILATYMARRPPAFVRNLAEARHINIAHGLYPRQELPLELLDRLAKFLSDNTSVFQGRTYAGGLTKFEPREMERLLIPSPVILDAVA